MLTSQQLGEKQSFLSQVDDKLQSDENVDTGNFNDEEEEKMIVHQEQKKNNNQCDRIGFRTNKNSNVISEAFKISIQSNIRQNKQQKTINFQDVTLKSTIVCLLLLSLVLVGVYNMIEQVYQISHPQISMQKRLTASRMNIPRQQQNSLSKVKQLKEAQLLKNNQNIQYEKKQQSNVFFSEQKENNVVVSEQKEKNVVDENKMDGKENKDGVQIQQNHDKQQTQQKLLKITQQQPKLQQQNLQIQLVKNQQQQAEIIKPSHNDNDQLAKTIEIQQDQTIQQDKGINQHQSKRIQQQSQLREKEQFIENYQEKTDDKKEDQQLQLKREVKENEKEQNMYQKTKEKNIQQKVKEQQVIVQKNEPIIQPTEEQKQIFNIPPHPQPPKIQQRAPPVSNPRAPQRPNPPQRQIPPHKPQQPTRIPQPVQRPVTPQQPMMPTPKANITRQQAIKWRQYQKMIEIPLDKPAQSDKMLLQEYLYYEKKYNISKFNQLPICVVVPTYNNVEGNRYQDNLKSILQQNYTNYHVVIIDDKSSDKTGEKINEYLTTLNPKFSQKIKVIINKERKMAMPNLRYAAMNECQQNQLFIIVDGDDLLIGRQVFKLFSAVMQQKNYWVMWTNFLSPKGAIGYSRDYPAVHKEANNYRKAGFVMSHLRAYYTKLFRLIKEQDLKDENGQYFHAANDVAIGVPILQMAHQHAGYVPEISYYYNMYTGLNNHKVRLREQKANDKLIRKKPKYQALKSLGFQNQNQVNKKSQDLRASINLRVENK